MPRKYKKYLQVSSIIKDGKYLYLVGDFCHVYCLNVNTLEAEHLGRLTPEEIAKLKEGCIVLKISDVPMREEE